MRNIISYTDFSKVDLRVGTIIKVLDFPEARQPAYQLYIDFGPLGLKKTSAQVTFNYTKTALLHNQVVAVVNLPKKQIAKFMSNCLVLGAVNANTVFLLQPNTAIPNGAPVR